MNQPQSSNQLEQVLSRLSDMAQRDFNLAVAIWYELSRYENVMKVAQLVADMPDNQALPKALLIEIVRAADEDPTLLERLTHLLQRASDGK